MSEQPQAPPLLPCPKCKGEGSVIRPFSLERGYCPKCMGSGKVAPELQAPIGDALLHHMVMRPELDEAASAPAPSAYDIKERFEQDGLRALTGPSAPSSGGIRARAVYPAFDSSPRAYNPYITLEDAEALERERDEAKASHRYVVDVVRKMTADYRAVTKELAAARQEQQILEGKLKVERQEQERLQQRVQELEFEIADMEKH